ncbi:MAG TPA: hypothetical protein VKA43_13410 [Gammaproteobacteria bacterium]|nr:hypothetical protein [Gammaproteobacteria bacterium]
MRRYLVVAAGISGLIFLGAADAQSDSPSFCATAGSYMHEIAVQLVAGATQEDAVRETAADFDAFATSQADLVMRRRVLDVSGPLARFASDLAGLQPTTVQRIGEQYCVARSGDIGLAPATSLSQQMAAVARECEAESAGSSSELDECAARAVDAREVRVARESSSIDARPRSKIQPFYEFGLTLGGDAVGTVVFVGGGGEDINAGDSLTAGGGFIHRITDSFGIKYTAVYKVWTSTATNADVLSTALPLQILPYYQSGDHRFGVGVSHHLSPKIDWDWLDTTDRFDDATGVVFEYAWKRLSFSYTHMDYESGPATFDASHFSVKYTSRH